MTHACEHCQKALADCRCFEEGKLSPFKAAVRVLFAPEAYGPEMELAVSQFLGGVDDPQTPR